MCDEDHVLGASASLAVFCVMAFWVGELRLRLMGSLHWLAGLLLNAEMVLRTCGEDRHFACVS